MPEWVGLGMYLGLGWLGAISTIALARCFGVRFILPLLWGAIAYTAGAIAEAAHWPTPIPGIVESHEVFHFAVLAGIAFHWSFIRRIADGGSVEPLNPHVPVLDVHVGGELR